MPTTDIVKSASGSYQEQTVLSTGATTTSFATRVVSNEYRSVPDTVKRPKPLDLFAGSTARQTNSASWSLTSDLLVSEVPWPFTIRTRTWLRPARPASLLQNDAVLPNLSNRLLGKIKDQKVNLTVSIPELGKTTDMVANLARDMYAAFRSLRRGRPLASLIKDLSRPYDRASRNLSKRWLEYTYGWVPAMHDIYGLSELIHQKIERGKYITVSVSDQLRRQWVTQPDSAHILQWDLSGRARATARYKVDNSALRSLSQSGITNPVLTAWELTPYSFVVDWVIDVGGYLNALDALNGVSNLLTYSSYGYTKKLTQTVVNTTPSRTQMTPGMASGVQTLRSRSQPVPTLNPGFPSYEPHLTAKRMVSAVALLRNLLP